MPDTGAPFNIPYVAPTDLVADWPTAAQDLAEAIADNLTGGLGSNSVSTALLTPVQVTSSSFTDVTGLTVSITPQFSNSKVLVIATVTGSGDSGVSYGYVAMARDGSVILEADITGVTRVAAAAEFQIIAGNAIQSVSMSFLDSPATTSSVTYSVQVKNNGSGTISINRSHDDSATSHGRTVSTISAIEVRA